MLSLQPEQQRLLAAAHHALLRQVLEGALGRARRAPERLLQRLLVQVGVEAGVLLDGGHAGAVQRGRTAGGGRGVGAGDEAGHRRRAGLLGPGRLETEVGGREGRRLEDPNRRRLQAAQELGILGK